MLSLWLQAFAAAGRWKLMTGLGFERAGNGPIVEMRGALRACRLERSMQGHQHLGFGTGRSARAGTCRQRRIALAILAALAGALPGCNGKGSSNPTDGTGKGGVISQRSAAERAERAESLQPVRRSILRERALEALAELATSGEPHVRANAVEALSKVPTRSAASIASALRDPSPGVRAVALKLVGKGRLVQHAAALKPMVDDPSPFVRAAAIFAMHRCGQQVDVSPLASMLLGSRDSQLRSEVSFLLGELGNPTAADVIRDAARQNMPLASLAEQRLTEMQMAEAMVKLGQAEQIETIRSALFPGRAEELEAAALAAQILGELGDKASIGPLRGLIEQRDGQDQPLPAEVRLSAASALAKLGQPQAGAIAQEYWQSPSEALRAQSAYVFGQSRQDRFLPQLERLLDDSSPLVRAYAAHGVLLQLGGRGG